MKRLVTAIMIIFSAAASGFAQVESKAGEARDENLAKVRKAIDEGNAIWIAGWAKGDAALVATAFAEDGVWLVGGGKAIRGRQRIAEQLKPWMQSLGRDAEVTVTTVDVWLVDDETAFETGKYRYKYRNKGKIQTDEGRYSAMWKRQKDGSWKLAMDMGLPS